MSYQSGHHPTCRSQLQQIQSDSLQATDVLEILPYVAFEADGAKAEHDDAATTIAAVVERSFIVDVDSSLETFDYCFMGIQCYLNGGFALELRFKLRRWWMTYDKNSYELSHLVNGLYEMLLDSIFRRRLKVVA